MKVLAQLQEWYSAQCDGEWEHSFGVRIDTLDNPGWSVEIDLPISISESMDFKVERGDSDWMHCFIKDSKFHGHGDPSKLESIITYFLNEVVGAKARE